MRMLLIEDDTKIASLVEKGMTEEGNIVDYALDSATGLGMALNNVYDSAIIGIMLPGLDGLSIIEYLRKRKINLPIIILNAKQPGDEHTTRIAYHLIAPGTILQIGESTEEKQEFMGSLLQIFTATICTAMLPTEFWTVRFR